MNTLKNVVYLVFSSLSITGAAYATGPAGQSWLGVTGGLEQYHWDLDDGTFASADLNLPLDPNVDLIAGIGLGSADGDDVNVDRTYGEIGARLLLPDVSIATPYAEATATFLDVDTDHSDGKGKSENDNGYRVGGGAQVALDEVTQLRAGASYVDIMDEKNVSINLGFGTALGNRLGIWLGTAYQVDDKITTESLSLNFLF